MNKVPDAKPNMIPCRNIRPPKLRVAKLERIKERPEVQTPTSPTFRTPYFAMSQDAYIIIERSDSATTEMADGEAYCSRVMRIQRRRTPLARRRCSTGES